MERRRALLEILKEVLRAGTTLEEVVKRTEKEVTRAFLEEVVKPIEEELVKSFYEIKVEVQPAAEKLRAEIAKAMGLSESGDLFEELRRALRSSESSYVERMRERTTETAGRVEDSR
ncbi:MAG: hypothetical protein QXN05_04335 [Acidilobaceae archaeon]